MRANFSAFLLLKKIILLFTDIKSKSTKSLITVINYNSITNNILIFTLIHFWTQPWANNIILSVRETWMYWILFVELSRPPRGFLIVIDGNLNILKLFRRNWWWTRYRNYLTTSISFDESRLNYLSMSFPKHDLLDHFA